MALGVPVQVSPLIKFTRWSLLLAGVAYGSVRHASLSKIENARRAEEEKLRPAREAKLAEEKKRLNREEQVNLAKSVGIELPADFKEKPHISPILNSFTVLKVGLQYQNTEFGQFEGRATNETCLLRDAVIISNKDGESNWTEVSCETKQQQKAVGDDHYISSDLIDKCVITSVHYWPSPSQELITCDSLPPSEQWRASGIEVCGIRNLLGPTGVTLSTYSYSRGQS